MFTNKEILPIEELVSFKRNVDVLRLSENYELEKCIKWIEECNAKRVCLQFSQDQLYNAPDIVHLLEEKLLQKVYVLGDTSYGTCCIDEVTAQHIDADAIIHFGHSCLSPSEKIPVLYVFNKETVDCHRLSECLKSVWSTDDNILLLYDVSYYHAIHEINCELQKTFRNIVAAGLRVENSTEISPPFTIFGRTINTPEGTDLNNFKIVYIGEDGQSCVNFKYLLPNQPFYLYNPSRDSFLSYEINMSRFFRRRMYLIECLKNIRNLGILIGTLCVKSFLQIVERIRTLAKSRGIKCYIISVGKVNVAKLANFPEIDAYVLISCAENSLLDSKEFLQPIVTPYEVELAFNSSYKWSEKYVTDFTTLLPGGSNFIENDNTCIENETNMSLVSGKSRPIPESNLLREDSNALLSRGINAMSLAESNSVAFLTSRSWIGLEPKLGESSVEKAIPGRSGIPFKYENESM